MATDENTTQEKMFQGVRFHGQAWAYFKIWVVNTLFSIITLGIYSAWAKVRTQKYFYQSTELMGSRFDYHAKPIPILKGRIVGALLMLFYVYGTYLHPMLGFVSVGLAVMAIPFLFVKTLKFRASYSSFRNIRFGFRGLMKEAYEIWLKLITLPLLLSLITAIARSFYGDLTPEEMKSGAAALSHPPTMISIGGTLVILLYILVIFPNFMNQLFQYVYNHLSFGGLQCKIDSTKAAVVKNIASVIYLSFAFYFVMILLIIGVVAIPIIRGQSEPSVLFGLVVVVFYVGVIYFSLRLPYVIQKYIWSRLGNDHFKTQFHLKWGKFISVSGVNMLAVAISFGLLYPWAKIRYKKMILESRYIWVDDIDSISSLPEPTVGATGQEVSDIFDFDFEIGL